MASKVEELPTPAPALRRKTKPACVLRLNSFAVVLLGAAAFIVWNVNHISHSHRSRTLPPHATTALSRCKSLHEKPGPPRSFWSRTVSDRFEPGTPPTLIQNATIWTGGDDGYEIVLGDVFLDRGLIKAVGRVPQALLDNAGPKLVTKNVGGAWVSPGMSFKLYLTMANPNSQLLTTCTVILASTASPNFVAQTTLTRSKHPRCRTCALSTGSTPTTRPLLSHAAVASPRRSFYPAAQTTSAVKHS
ncbi:hypothetical protein FRC12_000242 [Ceratobasidium sp. 428]|nr:hypothetical protein FRC12_000242 [Ceratobasidium sp. 428]